LLNYLFLNFHENFWNLRENLFIFLPKFSLKVF